MTVQVSFALKHGDEILFGNTLYIIIHLGAEVGCSFAWHFYGPFLKKNVNFGGRASDLAQESTQLVL